MASCRRRRPKTSPLWRVFWLRRCEVARRACVSMNLGVPDWAAAAWRGGAGGERRGGAMRDGPPYARERGFIAGLAGRIDEHPAGVERAARLLLRAHGLPLKIVRNGDPYPEQSESTAGAVIAA